MPNSSETIRETRPIAIFRGEDGKPTFRAGGARLGMIACDRPHALDDRTDRLIVPSVKDGPEFTAGQALMSAYCRIFGMKMATESETLEPESATSEGARPTTGKKGRKRK
jgi:hypothetical protein